MDCLRRLLASADSRLLRRRCSYALAEEEKMDQFGRNAEDENGLTACDDDDDDNDEAHLGRFRLDRMIATLIFLLCLDRAASSRKSPSESEGKLMPK